MKKTMLTAAISAAFISATAAAVTAPIGDTTYDRAVQSLATVTAPAGREEAMGLLEQSLAEGDGRAGIKLGTFALHGALKEGDAAYQRAIGYFAQADALGAYGAKALHAQAVAQRGYFLGQNTVEGRQVLADAQPLLEDASKAPDVAREVLWHLGYLEFTGYGGNKNRSEGLIHLQAAADAGHGLASMWLANHYSTVIPAAPELELKYLQVASDAGIKTAAARLAKIKEGSTQEEVLAKAAESLKINLEPVTSFRDGVLLASASDVFPGDVQSGGGVKPAANPYLSASVAATAPSSSEAESLRIEAASLRHQLAETNRELEYARVSLAAAEMRASSNAAAKAQDLRRVNEEGLQAVLDGNYEVAVLRFREGVKADFAPSLANLGLMYLNGSGVPRDGRQAISLFERAAKKGNLVAAENIARSYDFGLGVGRNRYRAIEWYQKAQAMGSSTAPEAIARLKAD